MNSCVSCLTWCIALPVLFIAGFVLGPWLIVLAAVVVLIAVAMTLGSGRSPAGSIGARHVGVHTVPCAEPVRGVVRRVAVTGESDRASTPTTPVTRHRGSPVAASHPGICVGRRGDSEGEG